MKKAFILLSSIVLVFGTTGLAIAIPFSDTINFDRYNLIGDTIPGIFDRPYDKWASQIIQLDESLLSGVNRTSRTIGFNLKENDFIRLYKSILNGEYTTMRDVEYTAAGNPVPEPATMFLFGTGMIYLAGINRKKILKVSNN